MKAYKNSQKNVCVCVCVCVCVFEREKETERRGNFPISQIYI